MPNQSQYGNPANYNTSPASRTNGDASALEVDQVGNLFINMGVALSALISGAETDSIGVMPMRRADAFQASINFASGSAQTIKAGTSQKSIYITDVAICSDGGAAANVILRDSAGTPNIIVNKIYFGTTPQTVVLHYAVPKVVIAGNDLNALCSSATPNVTVDIAGYVI